MTRLILSRAAAGFSVSLWRAAGDAWGTVIVVFWIFVVSAGSVCAGLTATGGLVMSGRDSRGLTGFVRMRTGTGTGREAAVITGFKGGREVCDAVLARLYCRWIARSALAKVRGTWRKVELGSYRISCAARHQDRSGREALPLWVQVKFKLSAETSKHDENTILAASERHRGRLDDAIITVFRRASIDELSDNRWAAIKSKLIDTIRPLLGGNRVRQIFFDDFSWEPI